MFVIGSANWVCDNDGVASAPVTSPADIPDGWLSGLGLPAPNTTSQIINDLCPACAALSIAAITVSAGPSAAQLAAPGTASPAQPMPAVT